MNADKAGNGQATKGFMSRMVSQIMCFPQHDSRNQDEMDMWSRVAKDKCEIFVTGKAKHCGYL